MIDESVRQLARYLLELTEALEPYATKHTRCKRKGVGVRILRLRGTQILPESIWVNGPSGYNDCSNEIGNCGCGHAEPRALMAYAQAVCDNEYKSWPTIMLTAYAPCTNCANVILDSHMIHGVIYYKLTLHDQRGLANLMRSMPVLVLGGLQRAIETGEGPEALQLTKWANGETRLR